MIYMGGNIKENDPTALQPPPDQLPVVYTVPDVGDENALTFQEVLEHSKMRMHQIQSNGKIYKKFYVPTYVENVITGLDDLITYSAEPTKSPWIETTRNDLTHGTLKMAVSGSPATTYSFKRIFTVRFLCKNVK